MKTKKKAGKILKKDTIYMLDEMNGVRCEYKTDTALNCYVSDDQQMDDKIVTNVMEAFWDSQPEYYRTKYNTLN